MRNSPNPDPRARARSELRTVLASCRHAFLGIGLMTGMINVLYLTGSFFMLEIYDRVLPSRSIPTLVGLAVIAFVLYAFQGVLDVLRGRVLVRIGASLDEALSGRVFDILVRLPLKARPAGDGLQPIRDLDQVRSFLSGLGPTALFDLPWMPLYIAICFLFHVWIGITALIGATLLVGVTLLTEFRTREPTRTAAMTGMARNALAEASRRNAEVLQAMGMGTRIGDLWRQSNAKYMASQQRASDVAGGLGALSKVMRLALQSGVLGIGAYLVIEQQATAGVIIAALLRRDLAGEALDLLLELRDALPELRLLAGPGALAELEQVALTGHRPGELGVAGPGEKLGREDDLADIVALGLEPGEAGLELVQALDHDGEVRLRDGLVEPHHDIARLDLVAVARPQFADDTAGRVLHLLDVRVDDEAARRDHGAGQLGCRRKPADAAGEKRHDRETAKQVAADRPLRRGLRLAHAFAPWVSTTLRRVPPPAGDCPASAAPGPPGRRSTLFSTSSFGPKVWAFPSAIIRMRSTPASALGRCAITTTMRPRARAPRIAWVSACSPSASRLEFGSSNTRRKVAVERARKRDALPLPG